MDKYNFKDHYLKAIYERSIIYKNIGNFKDAKSGFENVLKERNSTFYFDAKVAYISLLDMANLIKNAIEQLERLLKEISKKDIEKKITVIFAINNIFLKKGEYKKVLSYLYKAENVIKENKSNEKLFFKIQLQRISIFWNLGQWEKAVDVYNSIKDINSLDHMDRYKLYNNMSMIYSNVEKKQKEYEFLLKAYNIARKIEYKRGIAISALNLGGHFIKYNGLLKAMSYNRTASYLFKEINFQIGLGVVFNNISLILIKLGNFKKALTLLKKALESNRTTGYSRGTAMAEINFGYIYIKLCKFKEASDHLKKAEAILKKNKNDILLIQCYTNKAECYLGSGDKQKSYSFILKSFQIINKTKQYEELKGLYGILSRYYWVLNKKRAFKIFQKSLSLSKKDNDVYEYLNTLFEFSQMINEKFKINILINALDFALEMIKNTDFAIYLTLIEERKEKLKNI
ncbi:tetratricopeptide repeat protein [bacterium]|nr:tetratricopeptide repeat protein [bacterium]